MQYAIMAFGKEKKKTLICASEVAIIDKAFKNKNADFILDTDHSDKYEESLSLKLVYGCYRVNPQTNSKVDVESLINAAVNTWLCTFDDESTVYLGIEDVKIYTADIVYRDCGHSSCSTEHKTSDLAFSALVLAPDDLNFGSAKSQSVTAFVRYHQFDPVMNIVNREGLFSFDVEEKRTKSVAVTKDNWKSFIDPKRALRSASKM
ncbi:MAG: hypothetical protein HRT95_03715 [Moritella sp.]|uniref:hypothetical protein n=1 Tax=Moritella sp. TaxID=78556 RepID=UPI001D71851A|nr:hypothetical protein [Moritella sp.]NQZ49312.1 hypothetical protein [Moritella sp.]